MSQAFRLARNCLLPIVGSSFAVMAIIGAVRNHSPVPLGDMWDGYLQFYIDLTKGYTWEWYGAGNEHRFILSRILFWLDIRYFGGLSIFLIAANVVLMALLWAALCFAAKILLRPRTELFVATCALLLVPCFSWLQSENITWAFQSQFFLAYLLPLVAFVCFAQSLDSARSGVWFSAAAVVGCLALGTMANGTAVLPLLIAMVVLSRERVRPRLALLIPLTALMLFLYFHDYDPTSMPRTTWIRHVKFALAFLGSPFGVILVRDQVAELAGTLFLAAVLAAFIAWFRSTERQPMQLALLTFLAFVVMTSVAVAVGRAGGEGSSATAGRYLTPALLAWSALALLSIAQFRDRPEMRGAFAAVAVLVPIALLRVQLDALVGDAPQLMRTYRLGALALDLGVKDAEVCQYLYPNDVAHIAATTSEACAQNLSVFALPDLVLARTSIGRRADAIGLVECTGSVDALVPIPGDPGRFKALGWAFDPDREALPEMVLLADQSGTIIGAAYTGYARVDIAEKFGEARRFAGIDGYVRRGAVGVIRTYCTR